jgi:transposase
VLTPALSKIALQSVVGQVRDGTFPYVPKAPAFTDWPLYDRAQTHEAPDLLELLRSATDTLVDRVPAWGGAPHAGPGRPGISVSDRVRVLLWQSYRSVANRPAASELRLQREGLGVRSGFSYSTLARAYHDPEVLTALKALLWLTNEPIRGRERVFAVDGSGFPTVVAQHYSTARGQQRGEGREHGEFPAAPRPWVRNVANIGTHYGMVAGWKSWTDPHLLEPAAFEEVFRKTVGMHPGARLQLADGLYSARWVVGLAAEFGVQCRILPKRSVTLHARGVPAWPRSLWGLAKDPQGWLREYHQRSLVESFWSALKCRSIEKVRKRRPSTQVTEATGRAVVHNLRRLCYWHWVERIDPNPDGTTLPLREAS